jgi:serine/threonine-protein phosphatase 5
MSSPKEEAVAFKNQGNEAIKAHDWQKAIELYTRAIELDPTQALFYSNRAQVWKLFDFLAVCWKCSRD